MAEHMNQLREPQSDFFQYMGQPLPPAARQVGYDACLSMGLSGADAWSCTGAVAEALERDKPYEAVGAGMKHLDLTGAYRLMATLLAAAAEKETA